MLSPQFSPGPRMHALCLWSQVLGLLLGLVLAACERPPAPVTGKPPAPPAQAPAAPAQGSIVLPVLGTLVLRGDLAAAHSGEALFVTVKPRGQNMPVLTRRYDLADTALPAAQGTERKIPFELGPEHAMGGGGFSGPLVGDFDVEALFAPTGGITADKTGQVRKRSPLTGAAIELILGG